VLTVGVEEEFLLLYPSGAVAPVAGTVARSAARAARRTGAVASVTREFMAYQLETSTAVCRTLDELRAELAYLRELAARYAERAGARLVAVGAPPFAAGPLDALSRSRRYHELARRFPGIGVAGGMCACQVHVGVADRDLAVGVLARLRPWLPALLAVTVNSPFADGTDSGWGSIRYREQLRWPTFRPPGLWRDADSYDRAVRTLIASGAAMDPASVYFLARLSARYPTVEVRVADACLTVDDALLLAGLVRALVASLIEDVRADGSARPRSTAGVGAQLLDAARHGMSLSEPRRSSDLVDQLVEKVMPALDALGDTAAIGERIDRIRRTGTGAQRQRALRAAAADESAFVTALAEAALDDLPAG
jgi:glutamate---cysteine ligase / carboxylate-amine ligase